MNASTCRRFRTLVLLAAIASSLPPLAAQTSVHPVSPGLTSRVWSVRRDESPQSNVASALSQSVPVVSRGPFGLRPHFTYQVSHAEGVDIAPGSLLSTTIHRISPGLLLEIGEHWWLDYTPSWINYSSAAFDDNVDHTVAAHGSYEGRNLTLAVNGGYSSTTPVLIELGRQVHQESLSSGMNASYRLGQRTSLRISGEQAYREASPVAHDRPEVSSNWRGWSVSGGVGYHVSTRVTAAGALTYGFARPSGNPSMTFTRPELQVEWTPLDTLSLSASAGSETRQVHTGGGHTLHSPSYAFVGKYHPWPTTALSVTASRGNSPSYLNDAMIRSRGWDAELEQRLLRMLYVVLGYSSQDTDFVASRGGFATLRSDDYQAITARLSVPLYARGYIAVFWNRTENASSVARYTFTGHEYGAELTFRF